MPLRFDPSPLAKARRIRGLTLAALGQRINKSPATVSLVLRGRSCAAATVYDLCRELGVPTDKVWR